MEKISHSIETSKLGISRRHIIAASFVISFSVIMVSSIRTANAGLFSYISSIFEGSSASAQTMKSPVASVSNAQTLALLQAAAHSDPSPEKPVAITPIDSDGSALVADYAFSSIDSQPVNTQISVYTVQSGDTISGIAKMFGVSVNTVLWSNDLTSKSTLKVGQKLVILPITGINYTVKRGDTIQGIVKKYKADLDEVLAYNDITLSSTLSIGQTILIPNVEQVVSVPTRVVVGNNPAHDTNGPNYNGYYIRPVVGGYKSQGLHGYNAIDIAAPKGTPIYASAAGTVIVSKSNGAWNGGYGNYVIISHDNGTQTLYSHNTQNLVVVGQRVAQGEKIALMGATGKATGSHVHFEIRGAKNPF